MEKGKAVPKNGGLLPREVTPGVRGECLFGGGELAESYLLRFFVGLNLLDCGLGHFFYGNFVDSDTNRNQIYTNHPQSQPTICVSTGHPTPYDTKDSGSHSATQNPIHTKTSRPKTPGEFFKGHPTQQNFRPTPSPGGVRGRATSLDGLLTPPRRKILRTKGKK